MQEVAEIWRVLEEGLRIGNVSLLRDLNPPARADDIDRLQRVMGEELPVDFLAFLAVHDGQSGQAEGLFNGFECLSGRKMLLEWSAWNDLELDGEFDDRESDVDPGIQPAWWRAQWLPITSDGAGNHHCLDLGPTTAGHRGQVITVYHDMPARRICAPSFRTWFSTLLAHPRT